MLGCARRKMGLGQGVADRVLGRAMHPGSHLMAQVTWRIPSLILGGADSNEEQRGWVQGALPYTGWGLRAKG